VVKIPAGVEDGMQIRLTGEGDTGSNGGPPGNLYIHIFVQEHELFRREGDDLIYELPINFVQAALGDEVEVPTLNGIERLKIPPGTQPESVFRIKGKGIPHLNNNRRGDLVVPVKLRVPSSLDSHQRHLLEELSKTLDTNGDDSYEQPRGWFDKIKDVFD
jgi:molecular chaperone DnaJ